MLPWELIGGNRYSRKEARDDLWVLFQKQTETGGVSEKQISGFARAARQRTPRMFLQDAPIGRVAFRFLPRQTEGMGHPMKGEDTRTEKAQIHPRNLWVNDDLPFHAKLS